MMSIDYLKNWMSGYFTAWRHAAAVENWWDAVNISALVQAFSALMTLFVLIYLERGKSLERRTSLRLEALDLRSYLYEAIDRMTTHHLNRYKVVAPKLSPLQRNKLKEQIEASMRKIQDSDRLILWAINLSERRLLVAGRNRVSEGLGKVRGVLSEEERLVNILLTKAELDTS